MKKFEVMQPVALRTGQFLLTPEQLANRRYVSRKVEGQEDPHLVVPAPEMGFKAGEIIETDMHVPRTLEVKLRPIEPGEGSPVVESSAPAAQPAPEQKPIGPALTQPAADSGATSASPSGGSPAGPDAGASAPAPAPSAGPEIDLPAPPAAPGADGGAEAAQAAAPAGDDAAASDAGKSSKAGGKKK